MATDKTCVGCGSTRLVAADDVTVCQNCGLRMAVATTTMDYGLAYADGDTLYGEHRRALERFQTTEHLTPLLLPFERQIVERVRAHGIRSVVDLGCGTGRFLRAVEMTGIDAQGFEVAPVLVQALQRYGRRVHAGGSTDFLTSDLVPDAVSMLEVVEHLERPGDLIREIVDRKAPKWLFVVVPAWQIRRRFDARFASHDLPPNHLTWWSPESLRALLGGSGRYEVRVEPVAEKRRSLLGHIARNRRKPPKATFGEWSRALATPPTFWWLATARQR